MKNAILLFNTTLLVLVLCLTSCSPEEEIEGTNVCATCEEVLIPGLFSQNELIELNKYLDMPYGVEHDYGGDNLERTIGRILFYDKELSVDKTKSCASCHDPKLAFSDNQAFSLGVNGMLTDRNSIALGSFGGRTGNGGGYLPSNSFFTSDLFWDGRAKNTEEQLTATLENPLEMGMTMELLEERVKAQPYYQILFKKYGFSNMTHTEIKLLLSHFLSGITSKNSKFDDSFDFVKSQSSFSSWQLRNDPTLILLQQFPNYSSEQNLGKFLYSENCMSCHGIGGTNVKFAYNGLAPTGVDDYRKFRVPPLRNIEVTGPYMHDGRFETLEEVVDFYNSGMESYVNLHSNLKEDDEPKQFNFSEEEKNALIEFLKTFTDDKLLNDEKFTNPFK